MGQIEGAIAQGRNASCCGFIFAMIGWISTSEFCSQSTFAHPGVKMSICEMRRHMLFSPLYDSICFHILNLSLTSVPANP
jgi:hypothetical protein